MDARRLTRWQGRLPAVLCLVLASVLVLRLVGYLGRLDMLRSPLLGGAVALAGGAVGLAGRPRWGARAVPSGGAIALLAASLPLLTHISSETVVTAGWTLVLGWAVLALLGGAADLIEPRVPAHATRAATFVAVPAHVAALFAYHQWIDDPGELVVPTMMLSAFTAARGVLGGRMASLALLAAVILGELLVGILNLVSYRSVGEARVTYAEAMGTLAGCLKAGALILGALAVVQLLTAPRASRRPLATFAILLGLTYAGFLTAVARAL